MPYFIQKRGDKYCVVKGTKKDPGETKKCYPKRQDALDHMAALYVHVEDAGKKPAVKSLGDDRLGGYLVLWGSPEKRDLQDEYFTPETNFWLDRWGDKRPLLYHHGRDSGIEVGGKTIKLVGEDAVLGAIDTFKPDEMGLWVEAQLNRRHKYIEYIRQLIDSDEGTFLSSRALPDRNFIVKDSNGCIKVWPIIEGSLTLTPCEHRLANVGYKAAFHAIGENFEFEEVNMSEQDERNVWEGFKEKLFGKAQDEGVTLQEEVEKAKKKKKENDKPEEEDDEEEENDKPEEEDKKKKKKEEKKSIPEFILDDSAVKAIGVQVADLMKSALAEVIVPLQDENKVLTSEIATLVDTIKSLGTRMETLETTDKSAEEKAARIITDLPPIIKLRATGEVSVKAAGATLAGNDELDENLTPAEQRAKEWRDVIASIVTTGMGQVSQGGSVDI